MNLLIILRIKKLAYFKILRKLLNIQNLFKIINNNLFHKLEKF